MATSKPNLNRVWASNAPSGNVVDPDSTTPNKFVDGWLAEVPPFEHFNFLQQLFTQGLAHINEQGISSWDSTTTYPVGALAKASNGYVYRAVTEQDNNDPSSDSGAIWVRADNTVDSYSRLRISLAADAYINNTTLIVNQNELSLMGQVGTVSSESDNGGNLIVGGTKFWKISGNGALNAKWFDVKGDDSTDDRDAMYAWCSASNALSIGPGTYRVGGSRLGEFQKPLNVVGEGPDVLIRVMDANTDKTAFRVGAVGANFYRTRAVTKFQNLTFVPESGLTAPWAFTGIDVQSTFPIVVKDVVMLNMGPEAMLCQFNFYGYTEGVVFVNSGLKLFETNVVEFSGGEIRSGNSTEDASQGADLFGNVSRYPLEMEDSDLVKFSSYVFEGFEVPAIRAIRSDGIIFNDTWFEGLESDAEVMKLEQCPLVEFNSCQLDFAFPYTDCFILVDNSIPDADRRQVQTQVIRINGGTLLLRSVAFGQREELVKTVNDERVIVTIESVEFRGGSIFGSKTVDFDIKSIQLKRETLAFFYSLANAAMNYENNSWFRMGSASADWDFSGGADVTQIGGAGLTITTTTTEGEFMTGTTGVKVTGIASGATTWTLGRSASGELGPVTSEGQTYVFFARVKSTEDVTLVLDVNNGFADYGGAKSFVLEANKWTDVVLKTDEASTWAQAQSFSPTFKLEIVNGSGSAAEFYIDRLDYQVVDGDFVI